jgi:hypothetical protein
MSIFFVVILTATAGFIASMWALVDVLRRPKVLFRVAHVTKYRWLVGMALVVVVTVGSGTMAALRHAPYRLGQLGWLGIAVGGIVGLITGSWYLAIVRPWVAAQLRFAER